MLNILLSLLTITSLCGSLTMQGMVKKTVPSDDDIRIQMVNTIKTHALQRLKGHKSANYSVYQVEGENNEPEPQISIDVPTGLHREDPIAYIPSKAKFSLNVHRINYSRISPSIIELSSTHIVNNDELLLTSYSIKKDTLTRLPWLCIDATIASLPLVRRKFYYIGILPAILAGIIGLFEHVNITADWNALKTQGNPTVDAFFEKHAAEQCTVHKLLFDNLADRYLTGQEQCKKNYAFQRLVQNENLAQWSPTYHLYKLARRITGAA